MDKGKLVAPRLRPSVGRQPSPALALASHVGVLFQRRVDQCRLQTQRGRARLYCGLLGELWRPVAHLRLALLEPLLHFLYKNSIYFAWSRMSRRLLRVYIRLMLVHPQLIHDS